MTAKNEKIKILTGLAELYGFNFTDFSMALFLEALLDLTPEDLKRILGYGLKANLWRMMPKPGEILCVVKSSEEDSTQLKAKTEFQAILESVRRHGRSLSPKVSETAMSALKQIGGLSRIAEASNEDLVWIQKDFDECYELNADKKKIDGRKAQLKGPLGTSPELKVLAGGVSDKLKMSKAD